MFGLLYVIHIVFAFHLCFEFGYRIDLYISLTSSLNNQTSNPMFRLKAMGKRERNVAKMDTRKFFFFLVIIYTRYTFRYIYSSHISSLLSLQSNYLVVLYFNMVSRSLSLLVPFDTRLEHKNGALSILTAHLTSPSKP